MINMSDKLINITECPRDAMQGLKDFIPTSQKVRYINSLIKVGFDIIDFGSFVSPKSVPQMRDTGKLLGQLDFQKSTSLLSIVLNKRGALEASCFEEIEYLGFPLSISNIFQVKNSNKTIDESICLIDDLKNVSYKANKKLLIYISMAFGNPYNEQYSVDTVFEYINKLSDMGINYFTLADTVGVANLKLIEEIFKELKSYKHDFGVHFHSNPSESYSKIETAFKSGCKRFDSTINGIGGCPFAKDELVGNISTQMLLNFIQKNNINHNLDLLHLESACNEAKDLFKF